MLSNLHSQSARPALRRVVLGPVLLALGLAIVAAGCGRKGPLFLPPDDGKRPAEQISTPPSK